MALLKQQVVDARVTATHRHFAKLNNINKLLRVYSQNVYNLEERAGLTVNNLKLHGEINSIWCNICHKKIHFHSHLKLSMRLTKLIRKRLTVIINIIDCV